MPSLLAVGANPLFPHTLYQYSINPLSWSILLLLSSCKPSLLVLLIVSLLLPLSSHSLLNKAECEYQGGGEIESNA